MKQGPFIFFTFFVILLSAGNVFACQMQVKDIVDGNGFLKQGLEAMERKDFTKAIEKLTKAILQEPKNPDSYKYRGMAKFALKEYKEALHDFERALDYREIDDPFILYALGLTNVRLEKWRTGIYSIGLSSIRAPEKIMDYVHLMDERYGFNLKRFFTRKSQLERGLEKFARGRFEESLENFQKARERGAENFVPLHMAMGIVYNFLNREKEALASIDRGIAIHKKSRQDNIPVDPRLYSIRAEMQYKNNNLQGAINDMKTVDSLYSKIMH